MDAEAAKYADQLFATRTHESGPMALAPAHWVKTRLLERGATYATVRYTYGGFGVPDSLVVVEWVG